MELSFQTSAHLAKRFARSAHPDKLNTKKLQTNLEADWKKRAALEARLCQLVGMPLPKLIRVYILPEEAGVCASNGENKTILFGVKKSRQTRRLLLFHELAHILLYPLRKKSRINRLQEEILVLLIVDLTLFAAASKNDLNYQATRFHARAYSKAVSLHKAWQKWISRGGTASAFFRKSWNRDHFDSLSLKDFVNE